ncbi:conserved hypothetical protein [Neospora caninum Liverpool]|uniref:Transmembrane protein n=1 Tax=Neospora caninum (strain Liverpool) TaxID=572307 RepID=F0VAE2_NEOCL|nr:conserved hypothetical protein [Neospora caninum Liverpool]CBZ50631.1 conserved hypothetical protein [Neospora caninum Liverpool]CEL65243.1 TPA: hypothetical protein BN1204_010990 [Neospora caninum Liverpool]|eukprot:XP_003880664.1 conserved hypothetical protein [Neospora caninum Liverpool]
MSLLVVLGVLLLSTITGEGYTSPWSTCNSHLEDESSAPYQRISEAIDRAVRDRKECPATEEDRQVLRFCLGVGYLIECIRDNPAVEGQGFARSDETDRSRITKLCSDQLSASDPPEYRRVGSLSVTEVACTHALRKFGLHRRGGIRYDACKSYENWSVADYFPEGSCTITLIALGVTAVVLLSDSLTKFL